MLMATFWSLFSIILFLAVIVICILSFIVFFKVAFKLDKALDIWLAKNTPRE